MDIQKNNLHNTTLHKKFWDSLHTDILISSQKLTKDDLLAFIEQNYMFSLFFRGTSHLELISFQSLFNIKDAGYLILLELYPGEKMSSMDFEIAEVELYHFIKRKIHKVNAIGPLISNRISVLISEENDQIINSDTKSESLAIAQTLIDAIQKEYKISSVAGIGNVHSINSIYSSFTEALSCMHRSTPGQAFHAQDLGSLEQSFHYEYIETQKHLLDAIRHRKTGAYDYFVMMMQYIRPLNDEAKRNKIIEILVLSAHAVQIDNSNETGYFNYTGQINNIMDLKGDQIIEWAYQMFMFITGYVKPQSSIDYSNKVVQATKEFLEAHYSEEISLEDVAEKVNISPQYFSKLIKKNTGFNFIDWLSMLRVKKAKELLTNSDYTVKEVCFMVGYKDPNYFSRIFKKRIGITPSEYIKKLDSHQQ